MAFSNGYTYRKKITVDATKVSGSGSLTDFPVLVSHTDADLKTVANSGKVENASGYDIRFETTGGTELDYERLFYSATTGQIIAWVQATIDGTTSTEIYVYYGNSAISTDQSDPTGTWDANFKGVWHMTEDPSSLVVGSNLTAQGSATDASSYTTASISPSKDSLILASFATRTGITADPNTPTLTGCGLTWEVVQSVVYDNTGSSRRRLTLFRGLGTNPTAGTLTFDEGGQTQTGAVWSVDQFTNVNTSGTNGSGSVVQSAQNSILDNSGTAATTLSVTLSSFGNASNATFGVIASEFAGGETVGSGFTQLGFTDNTPDTDLRLLSEWKSVNDTSVDFSFDGPNVGFGAIAVEIRAAQLLDSTSNNYDMTTAGTMTSGDLITGQVYKAIDFDGTDDEAKNTAWASVIDENDAFTIEHWFNITSTPNSQFVAWGEAGANNLASTGTYGNEIGYLGYANDHVVAAGAYDDSAWHHLVVTHDGSTMKVLIDGSQVRSDSTTTGINASQDLYFARWKDGGFYPAKLEEIRISTGARSNDWAITTYETAKNPSTFYSLGTEETSGGGGGGTLNLRMLMGMGT